MNRSWLLRVRSADNASAAARVVGITSRRKRGGDACTCCISAPLFVGLPIFVLDGLVLLEPRDLMREQTRRNLRRAAADLRGGEERSYGKVERLFARVGAGGTCIVGQEL